MIHVDHILISALVVTIHLYVDMILHNNYVLYIVNRINCIIIQVYVAKVP